MALTIRIVALFALLSTVNSQPLQTSAPSLAPSLSPTLSPSLSPTVAPTMSAATVNACLVGCTGARAPVCGEDLNVYSSECAAVCQDIAVVDDSLCDTTTLSDAAAVKWVADGNLTSEVLNQFESEGFVYLGKQTLIKPSAERIKDIVRGQVGDGKINPGRKQNVVRVTAEGRVYGDSSKRKPLLKAPGRKQRELRDFLPKQRRELDIIGQDDRTQVIDTTIYPYSAIGQIYMGLEDVVTNICSGMVVSSDAVLTAGHCVNEGSGGSSYAILDFAPGLVGGTNPFGSWTFSYATTYASWAQDGSYDGDIAIIRYSQLANPDKPLLGDTVGVGSMTALSCTDLPTTLLNSGYPSDKYVPTFGYSQWQQQCKNDEICSPRDSVLTTSCDIIPGQSGSPLYMPSTDNPSVMAIYGVVSHSSCVGCDFSDSISTVASSSYPLKMVSNFRAITAVSLVDLTQWATE